MTSVRTLPGPAVRRRTRHVAGAWPLFAVMAVAAAVAWWGWTRTHPPEDLASKLLTATVARGTLIETVSASGSVTAQTGAQVKIGSQITGRIKRLYADVGSHVRAGQVIAELDLPDIRAQVQQAEANLALARIKLKQQESGMAMQRTQTGSAVQQARAQLQTARSRFRAAQASADLQIASAQEQVNQARANADASARNFKRQELLLERGFVAASAVDDLRATDAVRQSEVKAAEHNVVLVQRKVEADLQDAQDQVTQTEASLKTALGNTTQNLLKEHDIEQARSAVQASEAQVEIAKAQLRKTFIRTPISGTVLQLASQQGETVAAGLSAPTLIIVADLNRLQVDAYVDETDIGDVKVGQEAEVRVDAFPKRVFRGKVTKVAAGSTIQQGVVTYDVGVAIHDRKQRLRPDMTTNVTIKTGERTDVLLVPSEAVKLSARHGRVNVLTRKDGRTEVESRRVKTGGNDGVNTEIREGLKDGEVVVLAGLEDTQRHRSSSSPFGPKQKKKKKKSQDADTADASVGGAG
jgi:HlyD family secretion protein